MKELDRLQHEFDELYPSGVRVTVLGYEDNVDPDPIAFLATRPFVLRKLGATYEIGFVPAEEQEKFFIVLCKRIEPAPAHGPTARILVEEGDRHILLTDDLGEEGESQVRQFVSLYPSTADVDYQRNSFFW